MAHSVSIGGTCKAPFPVILKRKRSERRRSLPPPPPSAATSSSASSGSTEVDYNAADSLILLARGEANLAERGEPDAGNTAFLYRCKTCDKRFYTFQALGGHRASHKKPKMAALEAELSSSAAKRTISSPASGGGKQRTHRCSTCGSEFASGQALGGHMGRHRPAAHLENGSKVKRKERRVLLPDLNLPALADDEPFADGEPLACSPPVPGFHD